MNVELEYSNCSCGVGLYSLSIIATALVVALALIISTSTAWGRTATSTAASTGLDLARGRRGLIVVIASTASTFTVTAWAIMVCLMAFLGWLKIVDLLSVRASVSSIFRISWPFEPGSIRATFTTAHVMRRAFRGLKLLPIIIVILFPPDVWAATLGRCTAATSSAHYLRSELTSLSLASTMIISVSFHVRGWRSTWFWENRGIILLLLLLLLTRCDNGASTRVLGNTGALVAWWRNTALIRGEIVAALFDFFLFPLLDLSFTFATTTLGWGRWSRRWFSVRCLWLGLGRLLHRMILLGDFNYSIGWFFGRNHQCNSLLSSSYIIQGQDLRSTRQGLSLIHAQDLLVKIVLAGKRQCVELLILALDSTIH